MFFLFLIPGSCWRWPSMALFQKKKRKRRPASNLNGHIGRKNLPRISHDLREIANVKRAPSVLCKPSRIFGPVVFISGEWLDDHLLDVSVGSGYLGNLLESVSPIVWRFSETQENPGGEGDVELSGLAELRDSKSRFLRGSSVALEAPLMAPFH